MNKKDYVGNFCQPNPDTLPTEPRHSASPTPTLCRPNPDTSNYLPFANVRGLFSAFDSLEYAAGNPRLLGGLELPKAAPHPFLLHARTKRVRGAKCSPVAYWRRPMTTYALIGLSALLSG